MSIARTPNAKGTLRCRVSTPIAHEPISVVIDGRGIVEAYTKPRLPRELSNSPPTGIQWRWQMQGTRLRYVIKFVADMSEAVKFYRDVMGPIAAFSVTHLAADGLRL
jgi:hypothetical protein